MVLSLCMPFFNIIVYYYKSKKYIKSFTMLVIINYICILLVMLNIQISCYFSIRM